VGIASSWRILMRHRHTSAILSAMRTDYQEDGIPLDVYWRRRINERFELLGEHGVRQVDVARALKWSQGNLSRYLNGKSDLLISKVADLARMLGCYNEYSYRDEHVEEVAEKIRRLSMREKYKHQF